MLRNVLYVQKRSHGMKSKSHKLHTNQRCVNEGSNNIPQEIWNAIEGFGLESSLLKQMNLRDETVLRIYAEIIRHKEVGII